MNFLPRFSKIIDVLLKIKFVEFNINSKNNFTFINKTTPKATISYNKNQKNISGNSKRLGSFNNIK